MKRKFSFVGRLFFIVSFLYVIFAISFVAYQYTRERQYKIEHIDMDLKNHNKAVELFVGKLPDQDALTEEALKALNEYCGLFKAEGLRVTLINKAGDVLFDNMVSDYRTLRDHSARKEIAKAKTNGSGYEIKRDSESVHGTYFYDATYFAYSGYFVRSALPYNHSLSESLAVDNGFLWFAFVMSIILLVIYYKYIGDIGRNISSLREFAKKVEAGEDISGNEFNFPDSDLGEISHDIVKLYMQRRESEDDKTRLKRQLTQNIAHELKTPVSSIQGYLETIMSDNNMSNDTREQFLSRCYAQSNRLANLLGDISLLTSMDESSHSFEYSEVDLYQLIEDIKADVSMQLKAKKMHFFNLTTGPLIISGNIPLLYSIFRNLTDNAIAYSGDDCSISVKLLDNSDDFYEFSFADNGVGVAKEHFPHLFERFYRIDKGRSRKLGGTGLGLAIVKNAVVMHKGTISVKESATGGLEFVFTLKKGNR